MASAESRLGFNQTNGDEHAKSRELKSRIRDTRDMMDQTIDALSGRLKPAGLVDDLLAWLGIDAKAQLATTAKVCGRRLMREARENPGPSLAIAAGIAWLAYDKLAEDEEGVIHMELNDHSGSRNTADPIAAVGEKLASVGTAAHDTAVHAGEAVSRAADATKDAARNVGAKASEAAAKVGDLASNARHGAHRLGDRISAGAGSAASRARETCSRSCSQLRSAAHDAPIATGLGILAAGVLVGLAFPRTRREDQLLGETADRLKSQARHQGEQVMEIGKHAAESVMESAKVEAEKLGVGPEQLIDKAKQVASLIGESTKEAFEKETGIAKKDAASDMTSPNAGAGRLENAPMSQPTPHSEI